MSLAERSEAAKSAPASVAIPGRIVGPLGYGVLALAAFSIGVLALRSAIVGETGEAGTLFVSIFALIFLVAGSVGLGWLFLRVERKVKVFADRIERFHLIGKRTDPLSELVAVVPLVESRPLPRSSIERPLFRLRLIERNGSVHHVAPPLEHTGPEEESAEAPASVAHPKTAAAIRQLHGLDRRDVEGGERPTASIHKALGLEMALWHHLPKAGRQGSQPTLCTLLFREPVDGRHVVVVEEGRVSINARDGLFAVGHGDHFLMLVRPKGSPAVQRLPFVDRIIKIDAGFQRVMTDGPERNSLVTFAEAEEEARSGWPPPEEQRLPTIEAAPWLTDLNELATGIVALNDDVSWQLLASGSLDPLAEMLSNRGGRRLAELAGGVASLFTTQ